MPPFTLYVRPVTRILFKVLYSLDGRLPKRAIVGACLENLDFFPWLALLDRRGGQGNFCTLLGGQRKLRICKSAEHNNGCP